MKTFFAALALSSLPIALPAFAFAGQSAGGAEAGLYYQADSAISFGALFLAGAVMMAANVGGRRRQVRVATSASPAWRQVVMKDLETELQLFSRQLRRAA